MSTFLSLPKKEIGRIGGGRKKLTGKLDVAIIQSLVRKGVVKDCVGDYGHLIVDECHHLSARSFELVARRVKSLFRRHDDPVISIDAKKNELIGNFKNDGRTWCLQPEEVNMYDFPSDSKGRATSYGIYDQAANHALVIVGVGVITAAFAVASIRLWWEKYGRNSLLKKSGATAGLSSSAAFLVENTAGQASSGTQF